MNGKSSLHRGPKGRHTPSGTSPIPCVGPSGLHNEPSGRVRIPIFRPSGPQFRLSAFLVILLALFVSQTRSQDGKQTSRLPWEPPSRVDEPIIRPPSGPAEIFERFDIGPSQLESFASGQPLSPGEEDVLLKILYCYPRLGLDQLKNWRKRDVTWDQLAAAPAEHRAELRKSPASIR